MPRELITVQVGQCGNQIGCRFWDLALREHASHNPDKVYDDALSSFFKNVDLRHEPAQLLHVGRGLDRVQSLKARAVIVDMEEGVINSMLKSSLGELFDARSMLSDVSGAGNNWAHGHHVYGPQYHEDILDAIRSEAEACDSLQGFVLMHSLGGGTGSGLGSYLLSVLECEYDRTVVVQHLSTYTSSGRFMSEFPEGKTDQYGCELGSVTSCGRRTSAAPLSIEDAYPDVFRFTVSLFPSEDDDVVTSPYNSMLALSELIDHASAVLTLDNQSLLDIVQLVEDKAKQSSGPATKQVKDLLGMEKKPYDKMNALAANVVLNMSAGMRFEGPLNVDMNDITMNMVPFDRFHFLVPSMSPLVCPKARASSNAVPRSIDKLFYDITRRENQLIKCNPAGSLNLACGLLARGSISNADVARNIPMLKRNMQMAYWNQEGFKQRFEKLFKRQVYLHHYTQFMEVDAIAAARDNVASICTEYSELVTMPEPAYEDVFAPEGISFL